ncbi:MAG: glycosyltransferase [Acetivibrionales bacterium]|jgi:glycosyltransferase involved in cell wall biosynthesis
MSKFIIYTPAYNAEKTICRAVDSILNQTYTDFIYYLLDNASTDGTYEIIKKYAERDNRIIPLRNEINYRGNSILDVIRNHGDDCYLCELDADDEYYPNFLERMLSFMEENNLDVAACSSDFLDAGSGKYLASRKLESNLLLEDKNFDEDFPKYHQFLRTIWGKTYRLNVLRNCDFKYKKSISYGADTIFAMEAFRNAARVGILTESLHKYYLSPKSVSYKFDNNRILSDQILFDAACDFLISKIGRISETNMDFLYLVYLNAITDTLNVLLNTQMCISEKLLKFYDVFSNRCTQNLIKWHGLKSEKDQLFKQVASWVLSQKEVRCDQMDMAADILTAMNIYPTSIEDWEKGDVFLLLTKIRERLINRDDLSNIDAKISMVSKSSSYLSGADACFLVYFKNIVFNIINSDEVKALKQIEGLIVQGADIPDNYIEDFIKMALNLSAKLELHDYFVYFKKIQISLLIDLAKIDEAIKEFSNWDQILPDDLDFKELKKRLVK